MFYSRLWRLLAARSSCAWRAALTAVLALALVAQAGAADPPQFGPQPVVHRIQSPNERMEMLANSSRIISLDRKIPQVQVNNPDIVSLTPLSPTEIQVSAKKAGVTQINIWTEDRQIYTVDVLVTGDARELAMLLRSQFPRAALRVTPVSNSAAIIIAGYVDDPTMVNQIIAIAEDYYPKVHNHIKVGGGQQVLLQVRLMEVSRTKLRELGVDFANVQNGTGSFAASNTSGLLKMASVPILSRATNSVATGFALFPTAAGGAPSIGPTGVATAATAAASAISSGTETVSFGIINSNNSFFGFLEALRQEQLAKILAEPNLVTVSGRPAYFNEGGEIPILVPQSLGTISTQYRPYGTQVDFVPIVLGNGIIRLEVRPRVSQLDYAHSVTLNGTTVPALVVREVDTGVEMRAGQTLAIAGLVQNQVESTKSGVPWLMDLPYVGAAFRKVTDQINEVELLILVTPQLVEAMDPHEVPTCGPGLDTTSPTDLELYGKGYIEVPKACPPDGAAAMGSGPGPGGPPPSGLAPGQPQGSGLSDVYNGGPGPRSEGLPPTMAPLPTPASPPPILAPPVDTPPVPPVPNSQPTTSRPMGVRVAPQKPPAQQPATSVGYDRGKPYNPRTPQTPASPPPSGDGTLPGFIGATGYDVLK